MPEFIDYEYTTDLDIKSKNGDFSTVTGVAYAKQAVVSALLYSGNSISERPSANDTEEQKGVIKSALDDLIQGDVIDGPYRVRVRRDGDSLEFDVKLPSDEFTVTENAYR